MTLFVIQQGVFVWTIWLWSCKGLIRCCGAKGQMIFQTKQMLFMQLLLFSSLSSAEAQRGKARMSGRKICLVLTVCAAEIHQSDFPAKENPNTEKALFDWPIALQYDVKAKYRLISRKFSGMLCPFAKPIKSLCFRSFLFLFCSRVFISRSYENRSNASLNLCRGERAF